MSDIFLSYAKEDRDRVEILATALESTGWSVFWDRTIPPGMTWHDYIGRELNDARSVVVAWSNTSVKSNWVLEEAGEAQARGVLIPVFLDAVASPLGFRRFQALNLSNWDGKVTAPAMEQLIHGIERLLGTAPLAAAAEEERLGAGEESKGKRGEPAEHRSSLVDGAQKEARKVPSVALRAKRKGRVAAWVVLAVVAVIVGIILASWQVGLWGDAVSGRVVNQAGWPVVGAKVIIFGEGSATTNLWGRFVLRGLEDGEYELTVTTPRITEIMVTVKGGKLFPSTLYVEVAPAPG